MTPDDAARVMRLLSASWTFFPAGEDVATLWTTALLPLDGDSARAAAKRCATTMDKMPSLATFLGIVRDETRLARLAASAPVLAPGEGTYACRCGEMRGWIVVEEGNPPTLRPCPYCRPEAVEQWEGGHWMPDHSCSACERRRKAGAA